MNVWHLLIVVVLFGPTTLHAQNDRGARLEFLKTATQRLIADVRSGALLQAAPADSSAWRVFGPNIDSLSNQQFERDVLQAFRGYRATARDSSATRLAISVTVERDRAELSVDFGTVWCMRGVPASAGLGHRYVFARRRNEWIMQSRVPGIAYDPPPAPRELIISDACARAIAG